MVCNVKSVLMALMCVLILPFLWGDVGKDASSEVLKKFWNGWEKQVKAKKITPEEYGRQFAKISSPAILPEMVKDLRADKSDDRFFSYVLVVINWDPNQSRDALNKIIRSENQIDRTWAKDFLTELESYQEAKREGKKWR